MATTVEADLELSVSAGPHSTPVTGHLRGSGTALELWVSDPAALGAGDGRTVAAGMARSLASHGITVTLTGPRGALLTLGSTRAPWWQRRVTGTRHIRLRGGRTLLTLARTLTTRRATVLPQPALAPPSTIFPLLPTFMRRPRPPVTTTHDLAGGGNPRLVPVTEHKPLDSPRHYNLLARGTTIGSGPGNDLVLPGLAGVHAEVRRDADDEYVLIVCEPEPVTTVNGERARARVLRSGSRVQLGEWTLVYYRDEFADHGRPYGGRVGGEAGRQRFQPSYEDLIKRGTTREERA